MNDTYTEIQIQVEDNQQTMPDIDQVGYYYPIYLPDGYIYEDNRSIGKSKGYLVLKENRVILFWNDDINSYTIISYDVEADEIMKMAESMELQD